jgi:hypothetical protein
VEDWRRVVARGQNSGADAFEEAKINYRRLIYQFSIINYLINN